MRDIVGFEGLYAVTSCGKVWSYRSKKFLQPYMVNGYLKVDLCYNGQKKKCRVHRLVAEAYIPNPEGKSDVNHIDEFDKTNNCVNNLEWMTRKENINYGTRTERMIETRRRKRLAAAS